MENKDIRWIQRFNNYKKALEKLNEALSKFKDGKLNEMELVGMIKFFEMVYELAWLTIKDYYENQGEVNIQGSRDSIRLANTRGLIKGGEVWLRMIDSRKLTVHTYNVDTANEVATKILNEYFDLFIALETRLELERQT